MFRNLFNALRGKTDTTSSQVESETEVEPDPVAYNLSLINKHAFSQDIKSVGTRDLKIALDDCIRAMKCRQEGYSIDDPDLILCETFAPRIRRELHSRGEFVPGDKRNIN